MPTSATICAAVGPPALTPAHLALALGAHLSAGTTLALPLLAGALLLTGIITLVLNPRDGLVRLFALLLLNCAMAVGATPLFGPDNLWAGAIKGAAEGLGIALFVRFCLAFPARYQAPPLPVRWLRVTQRAGVLAPLATALLFALGTLTGGWLLVVGRVALSLSITFGILLGLALLGRTVLQTRSLRSRGPILVVWLSWALALVPLLILNVLPHLFSLPDLIPVDQTGYLLLLLPIAAGFATIRWRKVRLLALIDRVSVYALLALALLACYATLALGVTRLEGERLRSLAGFLPLALAVIAAITYAPIRDFVQRFVDRALYRDYYDLGPTVQRFSRSLATLRDREAVVASLLDDLCATLNLSGAALVFLPGGLDVDVLHLLEPEDLFVRRAYDNPAARRELVHHLARLDITRLGFSHRNPLAVDPWPGCAALVVVGPGEREEASALLILGAKRNSGYLRSEDHTLLATIAHQTATAFENAALIGGLQTTLAQLRQSTNQLELARAEQQLLLRELVEAEERERAALARDLHDDALQDLVYISRHSRYCAGLLADAVAHGGATSPGAYRLRDELEQLAQATAVSERKLRDLCAGLYPALIESLGLVAALESLAEDLVSGMSVQVDCEPQVEQLAARLDADARVHIYRIVQEALRNASRHAQAEHAEVRIAAEALPTRRTTGAPSTAAPPRLALTISVADDGRGMPLPIDYVRLLREGHLGLASMRERAERIGVFLSFAPNPDGGTRVTLTVPLPPGDAASDGDAPAHQRPTPALPIHASASHPAEAPAHTLAPRAQPPH